MSSKTHPNQLLSHYKILGLKQDASQEEVESSFVKLRQTLASNNFQDDDHSKAQALKCLDAFEKAYDVLSDKENRQKHDTELESWSNTDEAARKPRIGQLCVASGIITVEQLEEAVEEQIETGLPLGEVLENKHFISRAELEGLLLGQDLIDLEDLSKDRLASRILALELVTEDMLLIAQMETKAQGVSLESALVRRDWVSDVLMEILS